MKTKYVILVAPKTPRSYLAAESDEDDGLATNTPDRTTDIDHALIFSSMSFAQIALQTAVLSYPANQFRIDAMDALPLPTPSPTHYSDDGFGNVARLDMWTAEQMREYAQAYAQAALAGVEPAESDRDADLSLQPPAVAPICSASAVLQERQQELMRDNGTVDPDTGTWEGPEWVSGIVEEIETLIERIRAEAQPYGNSVQLIQHQAGLTPSPLRDGEPR